MTRQLISSEEFTSIQEAQAGLAKLFIQASKKGGFYRVLRNNRSLGVLMPDRVWNSLLEDLEALSSPEYLKRIKKARRTKKYLSAAEVKKRLGIKKADYASV